MPGVCRIGDIGYGTCTIPKSDHSTTGTIIEGAGRSLTEKSNTARLNDMIISDCAHGAIGYINSGSGTVLCEGSLVARIGDTFDGPTFINGKLISGAGTVLAGG